MGRLRLDIINDEMVVTLEAKQHVENGAFGKVGKIKNVDTLDREVYELEPLTGTEKAGEIVFVAHDGHRYEAKRMGSQPAPGLGGKFYQELNDGFDVSVEAGELSRGYFLSRRDVISVEPHVLLGEGGTIDELEVGTYLAPGIGYNLQDVDTAETAVAVIDGKELWCGYPVYVIRFL